MGEDEDREARTELIPAVETGEGISSTRELPAVAAPLADPTALRPLVRTDGPAGQRFEPSPEPGTAPAPPPAAPSPAAAPRSPSAARSSSAPRSPSPPRPRLVLASVIVVVLVAIVLVAIWKLAPGGSGPAAGGKKPATSAAASTLSVTLSSFDPSGGSGLRRKGDTWTTQTYSSPTFGNLKKGVGLVIDLGTAKTVDAVSFTGDGPTVSLRAGDSTDELASGYVAVGAERTATGATTLSGKSGGKHRYWEIWISRLASSNSASISGVKVTGS